MEHELADSGSWSGVCVRLSVKRVVVAVGVLVLTVGAAAIWYLGYDSEPMLEGRSVPRQTGLDGSSGRMAHESESEMSPVKDLRAWGTPPGSLDSGNPALLSPWGAVRAGASPSSAVPEQSAPEGERSSQPSREQVDQLERLRVMAQASEATDAQRLEAMQQWNLIVFERNGFTEMPQSNPFLPQPALKR